MQELEVVIAQLGPLTPREAEALLWVAQGKTAWEAGTILGIAETTTNAHIASAAYKLQATNRAHLINRAFICGVLATSAKHVIIAAICLYMILFGSDEPRPSRAGRRREDSGYELHVIDDRRA